MELKVKQVSKRGLSDLRIILLAEGLPVETILTAPIHFFEVETANGARIGWGGLEIYDNNAVLRSVVVKSVLRGTGAGKILVETLINEAKKLGIKKLWLLTNNAENFFAKMGFGHAIRFEAPKKIQECEEFTWAHHDTAHCMNLRIQ